MEKMCLKPQAYTFLRTILPLALVGLSCQTPPPRVTLPAGSVPVSTQPPPDAAETVQPVAATPTSTPSVGAARSNPAPPGSNIGVYTMFISVLNSIRPADDLVQSASASNPAPGQERQYLLVEVALLCDLSSDSTCSLSPSDDFQLVGSSGVLIEPARLTQAPDRTLKETEFFGGSTISGYVPFVIPNAETDLILVFSPVSAFGIFEGFLVIPGE